MINTDYDLAWEDINLVLQEIETVALNSGEREGVLAYTYGTVSNTEMIINHLYIVSNNDPKNPEFDISLDADVSRLITDWTVGGDDDKAFKYLQDCFDCKFRAAFDFQFKPKSLLKPLENILNELNANLDRLEERLDPFSTLQDICSLLNAFDDFCPQDINLIIMSLKMLMKQYSQNALSIRLDWTVLVGPILQLIVSFISTLIDWIVTLMFGPLNCVSSVVNSLVNVERQTKSLLGEAEAFGKGLADLSKTAEPVTDLIVTEVDLNAVDKPFLDKASSFGTISTKTSTLSPGSKEPLKSNSFISGAQFSTETDLHQAVNSDKWNKSSILEKVTVALNQAQRFVQNIADNIKVTLDSVTGLVGGGQGGLGLSIQTGGLILAVLDIISVLMMISKLKKLNLKPEDWCQTLKDNPDLLRQQLQAFNPDYDIMLTSEDTFSQFAVTQNGKLVGKIPLCMNARDSETQNMLAQWLKELNNDNNR